MSDLTWTNASYTKVVVVGHNLSGSIAGQLIVLGADSGVFQTGATDYSWRKTIDYAAPTDDTSDPAIEVIPVNQ